MTETTSPPPKPVVREMPADAVKKALSAGLEDFKKAPAFGLFFGAVFTAIGIVIYLQLVVWGSTYWVLPLVAGFPLLGPFLAVGLYEVSRRLEAGEPLEWNEILTLPLRERGSMVPSMAFVVLFFYLVWVYLAHLVFALTFGLKPLTNISSSLAFLASPEGVMMIVIGTIVGGALALLLYAVTVVAIPMLIDRPLDPVTAMITSFQSVVENRRVMLTWAATIAVLTAAAMLPLFLGMLIIFPILAHASWHMYRFAIEKV